MEHTFLNKNNRLGMGLDSLLGPSKKGLQVLSLDIEKISPNKKQPRTQFEKQALQELSQSIKQHGVLQPILVQPKGENYQIIAGERRWRASLEAGLHKIPAIVKSPKPEQASLWALLENLQRKDLNSMEQARAFKNILQERGVSQEDLSKLVCLPRSSVANILRLLQLDIQVQKYVEEGRISFSQAREILKAPTAQQQKQLAQKCIAGDFTVKKLSSHLNKQTSKKTVVAPSWLPASLNKLQKKLFNKIQVRFSSEGRGKITMRFRSEQELRDLLDNLWQNKN